VVEPTKELSVCRDPHDDKFFECAVKGRAQYIVSEDRDILDVSEYKGVRTIAADKLIALLSVD
jgi:predicted nucleic acid-binding protein